jgi:hypothetical protein
MGIRFFRIWKCLAILALTFAFAGGASAADTDLGNLTGDSFAHAYSYGPGAAVHDVFRFDLSAPSSFSAFASRLVLQNVFNLGDFSIELTPPVGPILTFSPNLDGLIMTNTLLLPQSNDYELAVNGNVTGTLGGSYSLLMAAVIAIPEPGAWALLLAGIALLLVVGARRNRAAGAAL